jgi:histidyl-tRNA synthetase
MGMIENVETGPQVYVAPMSDDQEVRKYTIRVANKIREQDIKTDIDFSERSIGKKFRRADKNDIPYTVVIGENEVNGNYVKLCDMVTGKDKQFPFSEAGWEIKKKIKRDRKKAKWWE